MRFFGAGPRWHAMCACAYQERWGISLKALESANERFERGDYGRPLDDVLKELREDDE